VTAGEDANRQLADKAHSRLAAVRAHLELPVVKRASGALDGRHRSIFSGHGQDFDEMAQYHPGDDVSDIDWRASASVGQPMIRRFERESNLAMALVVDTGHSMAAAAPAGATKSDIAQFACDVIGYLARGRGDTLALVAGDAERVVHVPARGGNQHMESLLRRVESMITVQGPRSDVTRILQRASVLLAARRTVVVLVTDEARPEPESARILKILRARHEVLVIRVADASPAEVLGGPVEDVEVPLDLPRYLWGRGDIATEAAHYQATRRGTVNQTLASCGIDSILVENRADVIDKLSRLLARRPRARS
jgi:uncharacterized protein (DUF58 family)